MRKQFRATLAIGMTVGLLLSGCGGEGGGTMSAAARRGAPKFKLICAKCHGPDGKGMPALGKDLTISEFVKSRTDEELLAFVLVGRKPMGGSAEMPPRGGEPTLSDRQILDIIAYVRTIEEKGASENLVDQ